MFWFAFFLGGFIFLWIIGHFTLGAEDAWKVPVGVIALGLVAFFLFIVFAILGVI